jgi:hypothetical protein
VINLATRKSNIGTIEKIGPNWVMVGVSRDERLSNQCSKCGLCTPSPISVRLRVKLDNAHHYKQGQQVLIQRTILNAAVAAMVVFGLPLLYALLAVLFLAPHFGLFAAWAQPLAALGGMVGGLMTSGLIDTLFRRRFSPTIHAHEC